MSKNTDHYFASMVIAYPQTEAESGGFKHACKREGIKVVKHEYFGVLVAMTTHENFTIALDLAHAWTSGAVIGYSPYGKMICVRMQKEETV